MNYSEKLAKEYLLHLGYKEREICYECEGQEGADFVINGRIAVEVTGLERHVGVSADGKRLGEEGASIPVLKTVKRILSSLGPPTAGFSWFVNVQYSLPAPDKHDLERELRKHLKVFQNGAEQKPTEIQVFSGFAVELYRASQPGSYYFLAGGFNYTGSGELVSEEVGRSIEICIAAKAKKLSYLRLKGRYEKCWLALVDLISQGNIDASDRVTIPPHDWDKVIMISPLDPTKSFELL